MNDNLDDCFTKVKLEGYGIIKTIGTGAFGRVYLIKEKGTKKSFALKAIQKCKVIESNQIEHSYSERTILAGLNNQFMVKLHKFLQDSRHLYFIMDFVPGGELFTLMRSEATFKPDNAKFFVAQLMQALNYLHINKIIYRDLKPENILFDLQGYIKLTDFGAAKVIDGKTFTVLGTPTYQAPEVVLKQGYYLSADWWSLGVLTYEMIVGIDPWDETDPCMIYQKIVQGKVLFPKDMNKDAKSFIQHLMVGDPSKRLGSHLANGQCDVFSHKWFSQFNWEDLLSRTMTAWYIPTLKGEDHASNYNDYPESESEPEEIDIAKDPFIDW